MTMEQITALMEGLGNVKAFVASQENGDPEISWGDLFFYIVDASGESPKMPFATMVIKDYPGFDEASKLDRGGLFRLNIELGKAAFEERFGFSASEFAANSERYDFSDVNVVFPHPVYGSYGWASVISPSVGIEEEVKRMLVAAHGRAWKRVGC